MTANTQWHTADDFDLPDSDSAIRTVSGRFVDLLHPDPATIVLDDIAHALSMVNRFGGHTAEPWSVAEHSIAVSAMLWRSTGDPRRALLGLLHDAAEAYLGDVVRPLKTHLDQYKRVEERMEHVIFSKLVPGFSELPVEQVVEVMAQVKSADRGLLAFEMSVIRNAEWRRPSKRKAVRRAFCAEFNRLEILVRRDLRSSSQTDPGRR